MASTSASPSAHREAVRLRGIKKSFGGVEALKGVDLTLNFGEVVALVGDNGAGKSTILKIIAGALQPDEGEILIRGRSATIRNPQEAGRLGIDTVFQDLALVPTLSIEENMFLGQERLHANRIARLCRFVDRKGMTEDASAALSDLGIRVGSMRTLASALSGGQRQAIAIGRAVHRRSDVLLLDEPTAALGLNETARLQELIQRLRGRGLAVLIISHSIDEVLNLADRACVLRLGRMIGTCNGTSLNRDSLVTLLKQERD